MEKEKPLAPLIGEDGNVFNLIAIAQRSLKEVGQAEEAKEMYARIRDSHSYNEALAIMFDYVTPCTASELEKLCETEQLKMY